MSLTQLEPPIVWQNFSALNKIPRPSKKEKKVIAFIEEFGKSLGLPVTVDDTGNVLIRKPATQGMENRKPIILQAHVDMVCQKNEDMIFDFEKEGIRMTTEGDWVRAEGTTLGADNGIGVAAIMSILESEDIDHPALEALFTIDEETGMTGAFGLKPGFLSGDILLNLDTEEDDEIDIGCAGGIDVTAEVEYELVKRTGEGVSIEIKGLKGGHSGMDIHRGRGNANVLLRRFLFAGLEDNICLARLDAGGLRNAIPREATAGFTVKDVKKYLEKAERLRTEIMQEYHSLEPGLAIRFLKSEKSEKVLSAEDSSRVIKGLTAAHNGVYRMSPEVEGLVEASNNIARISLEGGRLSILCLTRSSVESTKQEVVFQLRSAFEQAGIEVTLSGDYPGWQPQPDSEIVSVMKKIYREKFGESPRVVACHAGLECGIIGARYPHMEMVSFGPTIEGAHSPNEKVKISSVQKFWGFLKDILRQIPES